MRADAKRNYDLLLSIAREVINEDGVDASLRDIARRAGVGLGTLYRHFPTREVLLEALLRTSLDELTRKAHELEKSRSADEALVLWLRDAVAFVQSYDGIVAVMAAALADSDSALHASCTNLRSAGARLLTRAQKAGTARGDLDGVDIFALIGALGWIGEQPSFASHGDRLFDIITGAILSAVRRE
jgi:AcrR family transcriptional regulator